MRGIIVGAGIGGLSTAIALRKHDIDVKVYEAATRLEAAGAGILVPPNALMVLDRYGLLKKVKESGVGLESLVICDNKGRKLSKTPAIYTKNGIQYQTIALHRAELQNTLLSSLHADSVITNKKCSNVIASQSVVDVLFEDGTSEIADFVIGADGINSQVRKSLFPTQKLRYSRQICWRGISEIQLSPKWCKQLTEIWGRGIRFGFVPIGASKVYWYATQVQGAVDLTNTSFVKGLLEATFKGFPDPVMEIIKQADSSKVIESRISDLYPMESWFSNTVALIGDAAHASTPNIGQGGAQAIEDSWVLSSQMSNCDTLREAFENFQKLRYSKVQKIVNSSWQVGQVTNYKNRIACNIRNNVFRFVPNFVIKRQSRLLYDIPY
ncbi:FAD-dependent monooxygenase [Nitrincola sp. MINF-07-Sa-05]|uniref:FAD-dependent monooxygenase n=1 Tax=Nitrincola salilacus TaxID=3400273 RepID=UPI003917CA68